MVAKIAATALLDMKRYLDLLPEATTKAARLAINQVAERRGLPNVKEEMLKQVAFPAGYLDKDRLSITRYATEDKLEAAIGGRDRPTSLARFSANRNAAGKRNGVTVMVKPGQPRKLKRAFFIRLRQGSAAVTNETFNLGLAVRLKPGDALRGSSGAKKVGQNLYLLYGPSVDQIFQGVADNAIGPIADALETEFLRQFARIAKAA